MGRGTGPVSKIYLYLSNWETLSLERVWRGGFLATTSPVKF